MHILVRTFTLLGKVWQNASYYLVNQYVTVIKIITQQESTELLNSEIFRHTVTKCSSAQRIAIIGPFIYTANFELYSYPSKLRNVFMTYMYRRITSKHAAVAYSPDETNTCAINAMCYCYAHF